MRKRRVITNPDDWAIVKAYNAWAVDNGFDPLPKFDHSKCGPECSVRAAGTSTKTDGD